MQSAVSAGFISDRNLRCRRVGSVYKRNSHTQRSQFLSNKSTKLGPFNRLSGPTCTSSIILLDVRIRI